jgi:DNA helicase IV
LATPVGWRHAELRLGYRSPADVIELASRILPVAAPGVTPPDAVRSRRGGVSIVSVASVADGAVDAARSLAERYPSVAVITAASTIDAIESALVKAGLDVGRADMGGLERRVALVEARQAKGLEFDAVVVADPAAIVASAPDRGRGLRLLYVALTRPTQALTVVHADDLPEPL